MERRYFNLKDICDYTGLKSKTVYYLVFNRKIPFRKLTGAKRSPLMFDKIEIDQWIRERTGISMRELKKVGKRA